MGDLQLEQISLGVHPTQFAVTPQRQRLHRLLRAADTALVALKKPRDVSYWHKADIQAPRVNVRFRG
jgi:hypothetical protein